MWSSQVEARSKQILQNMVYYHMDVDDAKLVTSRKKEDLKLPDHLGKNLESEYSTWIKETYGPAFTCLQVAESMDTQSWRKRITDEEKVCACAQLMTTC